MATAAAVYFFVVKPYETIQARRATGADPDVKECRECTTEIPIKARRCPACTAQLVTAR
ncbi:MAG: hypothetical protein M3065_19175 [Actinomycetota bacterium]|nr:hypothetical protein [Actinomycetota bacterium]